MTKKADKKSPSAPVYQLPSKSKINALLVGSRKARKDMRGIAGDEGAAIANACEHDHLHKKAYGIIKNCDNMTDEKLAEFKTHFDDYFVKSGLQARVDSVERLPMGDDKANGKGEVEDETESSSAVH